MLLEHVFGQRPDDAQKVKQFVLDTIASDPGLQQTELVFLGLFGRACRVLENRNQEVTASTPTIVVQDRLCHLRQQGKNFENFFGYAQDRPFWSAKP